jgi:hypothetical protein
MPNLEYSGNCQAGEIKDKVTRHPSIVNNIEQHSYYVTILLLPSQCAVRAARISIFRNAESGLEKLVS